MLDGPWGEEELYMLGQGGNTGPAGGRDKLPTFFRNRLGEGQPFELVKYKVARGRVLGLEK